MPLWRVAVFVRTLHPLVMGRRLLWRPEAGVEQSAAPFGLLEKPDFRESTVAHVYQTGRALRRKLADADCTIDFALLAELRADMGLDPDPIAAYHRSGYQDTIVAERVGGTQASWAS